MLGILIPQLGSAVLPRCPRVSSFFAACQAWRCRTSSLPVGATKGFAGGVEPFFMSTTTIDEMARQRREATIICLLLRKTSLGADVLWLSFAGEP